MDDDLVGCIWLEVDRDDARHMLLSPAEAGSWVFNDEMKEWCKLTQIRPDIDVRFDTVVFLFGNRSDMSIFRLAHNI